ncbi:methionyl-tRNA formyltransferase [Maridesulfovibrio salexigens]|uniref:Methionyl-tRNA formyltransferase n=1 Tax=Maridesulfovibrio salexigens (strain ATCC 14822 / DSM 2638 / NCIMB 8403 / VKM B-1763) TaxID=526222 RepID=C6BVK2_MARSD|nr:methionyl-tRNA formyltransferase [Maridesulfovibrio salexigens]ACS78216.1 methionyl-tRNA formyltransferase [Maridesulfovibrio salexigens DSM 2638]
MAEKRWKIVFMGTPDFASTILEYLVEWDGCDVIAAYTQPDRKCGRGQKVRCSAVKDVALKNDIPVYQPLNFKDEKDVEELRALEPDFLVVAAYGLILPQSVLDVPAVMPINVHASLLPKYRGAAPIHRAVANGDHATGITIMKMEAGLDTGPILVQQALGIAWDDFTGKVHDELADMGGPLVMETLLRYRDGRLTVMPQDDSIATYAEKLSKEEGLIDWNLPVKEVHNKIRGMYPWPGAYYFWTPEGKDPIRLVLSPGKPGDDEVGEHAPGTIVGESDGMLGIACQDKIYLASKVKPAGKKEMDGKAFMCGYMNKC